MESKTIITSTTEAWPAFRVLRMEGIDGRKVGVAFNAGRLAAKTARERRGRVAVGRVKENPHGGRLRAGMKTTDNIAEENLQLLLCTGTQPP